MHVSIRVVFVSWVTAGGNSAIHLLFFDDSHYVLLDLSSSLPNVIEFSSELIMLIDLILCIGKWEAVVMMMRIALVHKATSTVVQNMLSILFLYLSEIIEDLSNLFFIGRNALIKKKQ